MAVVVDGQVLAKGAAEALLDGSTSLTDAVERMSRQALRTLGFARGPSPDAEAADEALFDGLDVQDVVGLQDPPRDEVADAIATLHRAGIRVVMITGDRPDIATAIAARLGFGGDRAVTGRELEAMSADELAAAVAGTDVGRDAADIVLLDDRFETIEVAVQEGRRIFANVRRFGQFLFSWHVAEVAVITTGAWPACHRRWPG